MLLCVENLTKVFKLSGIPQQVLFDVNLTIYEGEFIAITGPSGGGKSTLLTILGLLDRPSEGHYQLAGEVTTHFNDELAAAIRNQYFGYVFQNYNLIPQLSIWENVSLPLTYQSKFKKTQRIEQAKAYLQQVGLAEKYLHYPNQLSGGQQQRVAIARALITQPKIIFADEPTGNLDSLNSENIMNIFKSLNEKGQTIVMVTHNQQELEYASRVIHVIDGRVT
ncbi:ABC transporter ATP-binding protein [Pseudoalteromonas sp. L1]|uniref:ABC transporter ATP-binding protein n=1 Tax=Pseudoalteromonas sp. L1 TaxID=195716 RepID=UPI001F1913F4|nr:ABC transporter ATP-binding protein [Pseudoalteromonas sp. L1]